MATILVLRLAIAWVRVMSVSFTGQDCPYDALVIGLNKP
jgi:hypothetical protein